MRINTCTNPDLRKKNLLGISILSMFPDLLPEFLWKPGSSGGGQSLHEHLEHDTEHILLHPEQGSQEHIELFVVLEYFLINLNALAELFLS